MDWTVGPLDDWTIFFLGLFFGQFLDHFIGGGEVDHKYLRRGGRQTVVT